MNQQENAINIEELKKYLEANGLDTNLVSNSSFIKEKFDVHNKEYNGRRFFVYFEENENIISSRIREFQAGYVSSGPKFRIKKDENKGTIEVEEIAESQGISMDPVGEPYEMYRMTKTIYSLDENGELIDKKIGKIENHFKERLKEENITKYESPITKLQDRIDKMGEENKKQKKMLEKTLKFAEEVKNSIVGHIFFGKKLEALNEGNENENSRDMNENEEEAQENNLSPYEKTISQLKAKYAGLDKENSELNKMLRQTLNFAEGVKKSAFGQIFFGRKLNNLYKNDENER